MAISFNKYSNPYIPLHNRLTAYSGPLENHLLNRHKFKMVKKKSDIHKAFLRFQMTRKQGHFFFPPLLLSLSLVSFCLLFPAKPSN